MDKLTRRGRGSSHRQHPLLCCLTALLRSPMMCLCWLCIPPVLSVLRVLVDAAVIGLQAEGEVLGQETKVTCTVSLEEGESLHTLGVWREQSQLYLFTHPSDTDAQDDPTELPPRYTVRPPTPGADNFVVIVEVKPLTCEDAQEFTCRVEFCLQPNVSDPFLSDDYLKLVNITSLEKQLELLVNAPAAPPKMLETSPAQVLTTQEIAEETPIVVTFSMVANTDSDQPLRVQWNVHTDQGMLKITGEDSRVKNSGQRLQCVYQMISTLTVIPIREWGKLSLSVFFFKPGNTSSPNWCSQWIRDMCSHTRNIVVLFGVSEAQMKINTHVISQTSVQLTCEANGYPKPTYVWTREAEGSEVTVHEGQTLTIEDTDVSQGTYFCVATNEVDRQYKATLKTEVKGPDRTITEVPEHSPTSTIKDLTTTAAIGKDGQENLTNGTAAIDEDEKEDLTTTAALDKGGQEVPLTSTTEASEEAGAKDSDNQPSHEYLNKVGSYLLSLLPLWLCLAFVCFLFTVKRKVNVIKTTTRTKPHSAKGNRKKRGGIETIEALSSTDSPENSSDTDIRPKHHTATIKDKLTAVQADKGRFKSTKFVQAGSSKFHQRAGASRFLRSGHPGGGFKQGGSKGLMLRKPVPIWADHPSSGV